MEKHKEEFLVGEINRLITVIEEVSVDEDQEQVGNFIDQLEDALHQLIALTQPKKQVKRLFMEESGGIL